MTPASAIAPQLFQQCGGHVHGVPFLTVRSGRGIRDAVPV